MKEEKSSYPDHPLSSLFPIMGEDELIKLAGDIKDHGLLDPIILLDGKILDGRNRFRSCKIAEVKPRFAPYQGTNPTADIISWNLHRRHLNESQRAMIGARLANMPAHRPENKSANLPTYVSQPAAAAMVNVSERMVRRAKEVRAEAMPKELELIESGKKSINAVRKNIKERKRKKSRKKAVEGIKETHDNIIIGDFRECGKNIPDGSLSLIYTDPPYNQKALEILPALAEFAKAKLADGGSILLYVGHLQLTRALEVFKEHLRFWWVICCLHSGGKSLIREYGIYVGWKPILWFVKNTRDDPNTLVDDVVSGGKEKDHHEWQQAQSEAEYWIGKLCPNDGIVCDPFLGGGTTGAAAERLKRKWIGIEIDSDTAKIAAKRIREL